MTNQQNFDLTGKVALITGASRGIGQLIAETFAKAGAKVVLASRKQEGLEIVAKQIKETGGEAIPISAHTGSNEAVQNLVSKACDTFGGIDIVVNNAGTNPHFGPILTAEESQWDKILDVNLKGYFRVVKACIDNMRERGGGKIINMASVAGIKPAPAMGVYCVSKAGVIMLTKVLALELAQDNIQVNAIAPGFVKTKFSQAVWGNEMIHDMLIKETPQKRIAGPEEITGLALYLASQASNYVTGSVFVADGGLMVGSFMEFYS
ncbi:MAG: SDR family NAD(P)-dependent oxidoreductase [Candidatus Hodarchaeales archaeon]|jgi:NAD(P)-dependent dehydrogenase (short-subunit alcohol dehydrogenase family)